MEKRKLRWAPLGEESRAGALAAVLEAAAPPNAPIDRILGIASDCETQAFGDDDDDRTLVGRHWPGITITADDRPEPRLRTGLMVLELELREKMGSTYSPDETIGK